MMPLKIEETLDREFRNAAYHNAAHWMIDPAKAQAFAVPIQGFSSKLLALEEFIDGARVTTEVPIVPIFNPKTGTTSVHLTPLAKRYFARIPDFIRAVKALSSRYLYNEHINAFIRCSKELGLFEKNFEWGSPAQAHRVKLNEFGNKTAAEIFDELVAKLGDLCRSKEIRARMRYRRNEARKRHRLYMKYVNSLFRRYKRLLVIRLEFFYLPELAHSIGIKDAIADIDHFLANQRCNAIFNGLVGYVIKIEYGVDKGIHAHVLIFLDGNERDNRCLELFGKQFGDYWADPVTQGRGDYWNLNEQKNIEHLDRRNIRGIGVIHESDTNLRDNLNNRVLAYLCKGGQFFAPAYGRDFHQLRKGQDPARKKPRAKLKKRAKLSSNSRPLLSVKAVLR